MHTLSAIGHCKIIYYQPAKDDFLTPYQISEGSMRKLQKLLALLGFILMAAHLTSLPGLASTGSGSTQVTPAARKASPEKLVGGLTRLPGHVLPALKRAAPVPASPRTASEPLTLTVVLKRADQSAFDAYLHELYDPNSPSFRHFLKQDEIAEVFGPTRDEYQQVSHYLGARGFKLVEGSANRLTLTVRGTRAQAEKAFALHIGDYRLGDRKFYANDKDPAMPARIASSIQAVAGLSDLARPRANVSQYGPDFLWIAICKDFWGAINYLISITDKTAQPYAYQGCANQWNKATSKYDGKADPPGIAQNDGTGQTVGLIEFDTFQLTDVADFLSLIGSPPAEIGNVTEVNVNGGAAPGPNQDEVLLDIDTILSIAPGAQVVVYDAPFSGPGASFQTLFNAAINGGSTIISNSWAYCEDQTTLADVQSIDSIFQAAEASGIAIFNGAGDSGSTCLDGSANTVGVPADSPNATSVGGSSENGGPGYTYGPETWWDGADSTPPTGQGGFGVSKFFPTPNYQIGLTTSVMRSVPDVVVNADPALGVLLCQASTGGCPNGLLYGGTSMAAPAWAAFAALLNQALGHNLGAFNQSIYPFANTSAFHNAASLGSDFAHVGLGSPNLSQLYLELGGITVGTPDPSFSLVLPFVEGPWSTLLGSVPADGTSQGYVNVMLLDASGNPVPGKTVTLSANSGSHAQISPASAVTTVNNGTATFTLTDLTPENITVTATDATDDIELTTTVTSSFVVPPAASAGINVLSSPVTADGVSSTTITLTLQDSLGRPTPGKLVTLIQGSGHSVISGPTPSVTGSSGQITFTVVDQVAETVTYSAIDVTDGNLPFPASGTVTFINGPVNECGNGNPIAAPGYLVTPYATGFVSQNFSYGGIAFNGCPGAFGIAFDGSGNLYVSHAPTGNIYKFPPGGGVADSSTLLTQTPIGPFLGNLAFENGNLYAGRSTTAGPTLYLGAVYKIDPNAGTVLNTFATNLTCPAEIAIDPLSGDLFVGDSCGGNGSNNPSLWRISNPAGASPTTSVYATMPGSTNTSIAFAPSGTFYVWDYLNGAQIVQVSGTNGPTPPTITPVSGLSPSVYYIGLLAGGTQSNGDAAFLIFNYAANGSVPGGIGIADLTTNPASISTILVNNGVVNDNNLAVNPTDGCVYAALSSAVFKITDAGGACNYTAAQPSPAIALTPTTVSPSPAQGTSQSFTAALHYVTAPAGVPLTFQVRGANPQSVMVQTGANGQASFSYTAVNAGADTVLAFTTINSSTVSSNPVQVTWTSGLHTTFLTLNPSPTGGTVNAPVNVIASLTDLSVNPVAPLAGESVSFSLDGDTCFGSTGANGIASCAVTPATIGLGTLTASFAGNSQYLPATTSKGFSVSGLATKLSYTGPAALTNGNSAALSAVLTTAQGSSPVSGETITFTLGSGAGAQTCSGTTNGAGTAGCNIASVSQPVGPGTLTSSFAGDMITYQPSSVTTSVTINAAPVSVPNVVGDTQSAATTAIKGAGLVVGTVTTQSSSTVPAGDVISQSPLAGASVAPATAVNLVVSSGPAPTGKPEISGQIIAKRMGPSGTVFVDLKLTDTGTADAVNVQIGHLTLSAICGIGTVSYNTALSGPLPLKVGNIKKGASTTVRLFFNVPSKVTGFTFTESGTMQDTAGKNYNYSTTQTVTLCHEWYSPGQFGQCDRDDCGHVCF
jgi:kumamolisin